MGMRCLVAVVDWEARCSDGDYGDVGERWCLMPLKICWEESPPSTELMRDRSFLSCDIPP